MNVTDLGHLSQYCDELADVVTLIKDQNIKIQVDVDNKILSILMKSPLKKDKYVKMADIKMNYIHPQQKDYLQIFIEKCRFSQFQLNKQQTKNIILQLIHQIKILKQNNKERLQECQLPKNIEQSELNILEQIDIVKNIIQNKVKALDYKIQELNDRTDKKIDKWGTLIQSYVTEVKLQINGIQQRIKQKLIMSQKQLNTVRSDLRIAINRIQESYSQQNQILNKKMFTKIDNIQLQQKLKRVQGKYIKLLSDFENKIVGNIQKHSHESKRLTISGKIQLPKKQLGQIHSINKHSQQIIKQNHHKIKSSDWVDKQCFYFNELILKDDIITSTSKPGEIGISIFGRNPLDTYGAFSIYILKKKGINFWIKLGVADTALKTKRVFTNEKNLLWYSSIGIRFDGKASREQGNLNFMEGTIVTVSLDLAEGIIEWSTGENQKYKLKCPQLQDKNIMWVPYLCLNNGGQSVKIIKQQ